MHRVAVIFRHTHTVVMHTRVLHYNLGSLSHNQFWTYKFAEGKCSPLV